MSFADLNDAGLLAIALIPEWVDQDAATSDYTGAPDAASAGVYLQASPKAVGEIKLREEVHRRTARIVVGVGDTATTYTISIDGNTVATVPSASVVATTVSEWADDINADVTVGALVTASVDPDDATGATLLIQGIAEADYSIDYTLAGGTGTVTSFTADASSAAGRFFVSRGGLTKSGSDTGKENSWALALNGDLGAITYRGMTERFDVAGYTNGYLEVYDIAGVAGDGATNAVTLTIYSVAIGPAVLEATS